MPPTNPSAHWCQRFAALVPGAAAGLIAEVVVADAGSLDATAEVADIAGCRFMASRPYRYPPARGRGRHPQRLGCCSCGRARCPQPGWIEAADSFIQATELLEGAGRAAVFRPPGAADLMRPGFAELVSLLRVAFGGGPRPGAGPADRQKLLRGYRWPPRWRRRRGRLAEPPRPSAHMRCCTPTATQPRIILDFVN